MEILKILEGGPLLGKELYALTSMDIFQLWRLCSTTTGIVTRRVGQHYLRFDKKIEGYARLSPAIQREFLTYTVVGLERDRDKIEERLRELKVEIERISKEKFRLATSIAEQVLGKLGGDVRERVCFIIGGDVPLGMAHRDPRPERSTGEMVSGSDLDIIVAVSDDLPEEDFKAIDDGMYEKKHALMSRPVKEEVDYLVKRLSRIKEQVEFDSFEKMVACKIIDEGEFLYGSRRLYEEILSMLKEHGIPEKLRELEAKAREYRREAEAYLLERQEISEDEYMKLFTTTEEFSEIF
jgi:hypothetical protein